MPIARKIQENMISGSWIRDMFEEGIRLREKYGAGNVFDLSAGNPVIEPPDVFRDEMKRLVETTSPGRHRYMPNAGFPETRSAVASLLTAGTNTQFSGDDVVMTCGTAGALNCTFKALLEPGDEVIALAPYFFEYDFFTDNHGGVIRVVPAAEDLTPDIGALRATITERTKAVIVNSPNNPTGIVYGSGVLEQISEALREKAAEYGTQIFAISDDVYCRLVFDGLTCPRIVDYYDDTVIVSSFSKDLSLPGERIGYAAVNPRCNIRTDVVNGIIYGNRVLGFLSAPALQQRLVTGSMNHTVDVYQYQAKRDLLYEGLTSMGYSVVKPQGAFYMFPQTPTPDDMAFCRDLQEALVLVVPGTRFNAPGYFRISYCVEDTCLEGSLRAFEKAISKYGN
jgi:aspartate aminotransferase